MKIKAARKVCEDFAIRHKVVFEDEGEVGFCRPCVGFLRDSYVDYNPINMKNYEEKIEGFDEYLSAPVKDAYHKHDCMAVLVYDDGYDKAIIQLAEWVKEWESKGPMEVVTFRTGYGPLDGFAAMLHGSFGYAIRYELDD